MKKNRKFNQKGFNNFIIQNKVVGFFKKPIKLKSGRLSNWYVNWRNIAEDVYLLDKLTDYVISFVENLNLKPDCFYGVPEGATKLALITQYKWARKSSDYGPGSHVLSMGRGKPKDHGDPKDRYFVGTPKGKVIILEDVTTTGSSLISAIDNLKKIKNVKIIAAISLTNRNEIRDDGKTVEDIVRSKGIRYYAMSNALELLPKIYKKLKEREKKEDKHEKKEYEKIAELVEKYFEKYCIKKIKLE